MGQYQVSGGVSVICWHAAPIAHVLWKPPAIRLKVEFGNKVQSSNRVKNWCKAWSMKGVAAHGHHQKRRVTIGRGRLIFDWQDLETDHINFLERIWTFFYISLLIGKTHHLHNKTFKRMQALAWRIGWVVKEKYHRRAKNRYCCSET